MVIPVGPGVLSLRPPCFQQLRLALSQSATLTSGPARCPRRARHSQRAATLCRQHPVLACQHGRIHRSQSHRKKAPLGCFLSVDPGSYLSFHDCAAWSFPSGQASSRYGLPVFSSSASPCRSLQPLRPGRPAARVGPATGSGRRPCVASTLCWLTGMENTSFPKPQKESTLRVLSQSVEKPGYASGIRRVWVM